MYPQYYFSLDETIKNEVSNEYSDNIKPDLVIFHQSNEFIPIFPIEVKLNIQDSDMTQLFNYMKMIYYNFNVKDVVGILTDFKEWIFCMFEHTYDKTKQPTKLNELKLVHSSRVSCNNKNLPMYILSLLNIRKNSKLEFLNGKLTSVNEENIKYSTEYLSLTTKIIKSHFSIINVPNNSLKLKFPFIINNGYEENIIFNEEQDNRRELLLYNKLGDIPILYFDDNQYNMIVHKIKTINEININRNNLLCKNITDFDGDFIDYNYEDLSNFGLDSINNKTFYYFDGFNNFIFFEKEDSNLYYLLSVNDGDIINQISFYYINNSLYDFLSIDHKEHFEIINDNDDNFNTNFKDFNFMEFESICVNENNHYIKYRNNNYPIKLFSFGNIKYNEEKIQKIIKLYRILGNQLSVPKVIKHGTNIYIIFF